MKWLNETELEGRLVKMVPLNKSYKDTIIEAASDGKLWNLWFTGVPSASTVSEYINFALKEHNQDRALPFVIIDKKTNKTIGTTRYCNATPNHRRLEIGYTWYAKSYQRTGVNTECKYLLLSHAFENLECIAVEFRTHFHNHSSRNAISRIGAKQDGILRNHWIDSDGGLRDTVVFSILQDEWKTVKKLLEYKMRI